MKQQKTLLQRGHDAYQAGQYPVALAAFIRCINTSPEDPEPRLAVVDTLLTLGREDQAFCVLGEVAKELPERGRPVEALAAVVKLDRAGGDSANLMQEIARLYCRGSDRLPAQGRSSPPPLPPRQFAPDGPLPIPAEDLETLIQGAVATATKFPPRPNLPTLPVVPLFSSVGPDLFVELLWACKMREFQRGQQVVQQGDPGESFFLITTGQVEVSRWLDDGTGRRVAVLGKGSVFGEMSIVSRRPRNATVTFSENGTALEFPAAMVSEAGEAARLREALLVFYRSRVIWNLLRTSPLFSPCREEEVLEISRRFRPKRVQEGQSLMEEGQIGSGLCVVLDGSFEVLQTDRQGDKVVVASVGPGQVIGEMSLVTGNPVSATVIAVDNATVLRLTREDFEAVVAPNQAAMEYLRRLTDSRWEELRAAQADEVVEIDEEVLL